MGFIFLCEVWWGGVKWGGVGLNPTVALVPPRDIICCNLVVSFAPPGRLYSWSSASQPTV